MSIYVYFIILLLIIWFFPRNTNGSKIKKLIRQSARYATAAQQDESPIVATLHANYAAGYLWAVKDIATPREINRYTGVDIKKFEEHILNVQDSINKKLVQKCPEFAAEVDLYLSSIGGES